jgi:hypothetical protein
MTVSDTAIPQRKHRRPSCLVLGIGLVAAFLCWALVGLSFNFSGQSPLQQLKSAREVWNKQGIDDYTMTLAYSTMSNIGRYNFVIQDDAPVSVAVWSPLLRDSTPEPMLNFESVVFRQDYGDYFPENLTDYTIDGSFDYAAQKLADQRTPPLVMWCGMTERMHAKATFDEKLGYINSFSYSDAGYWNLGGGLLCNSCNTLHCYSGIRILDFKPIE